MKNEVFYTNTSTREKLLGERRLKCFNLKKRLPQITPEGFTTLGFRSALLSAHRRRGRLQPEYVCTYSKQAGHETRSERERE